MTMFFRNRVSIIKNYYKLSDDQRAIIDDLVLNTNTTIYDISFGSYGAKWAQCILTREEKSYISIQITLDDCMIGVDTVIRDAFNKHPIKNYNYDLNCEHSLALVYRLIIDTFE